MKSRERFVTALRCGIPDRVPVYDFVGSRRLQKQLLGYATDLYEPETQAKMAALLGFDGFLVFAGGFCGIEEESHPDGSAYCDAWGITYQKRDWPIMPQVAAPIKSRSDWANYRMPDPEAPHQARMVRAAVRANPKELAVLTAVLGPVTMLYWYLMDPTTFSTMLYEDPDLIHAMCRAYADWAARAARFAVQSGPIDAFYLADDWGGSSGLLMSPKHLRQFFLKPYADIVRAMQGLGVPVIMHNDGKIGQMLDDLVATGINGYHPVEKAAGMELAVVKRRYGGRICPIGNINNKTTMVSGTPEEVRREALECLRIAAPGGGYILATDHSLHDDVPWENILAYVDVARRYGTYPLNLPEEASTP